MMIKITERCTMGCKHCLNDAQPDGKDIEISKLIEIFDFLQREKIGKFLIISGGEPTEHREFDKVMEAILEYQRESQYFHTITITTNGEQIEKDPEKFKNYIGRFKTFNCNLIYQVSADVRYYPRRIKVHKRIFREDGFVMCDNCVESIYPIGRALTNNIKFNRASSQCYNVRALSKQGFDTLWKIESYLRIKGKYCTPHISINGEIKLGESDLCTVCATINDLSSEIMEKIQKFKCNKCNFLNKNLSPQYRKFVE